MGFHQQHEEKKNDENEDVATYTVEEKRNSNGDNAKGNGTMNKIITRQQNAFKDQINENKRECEIPEETTEAV